MVLKLKLTGIKSCTLRPKPWSFFGASGCLLCCVDAGLDFSGCLLCCVGEGLDSGLEEEVGGLEGALELADTGFDCAFVDTGLEDFGVTELDVVETGG